jgi:hypothetical protein
MSPTALELVRIERTLLATRGVLLLDKLIISVTLEDRDRQIHGAPVSDWKVDGGTCIPTGTYPIYMRYSPRFQAMRPFIGDVEGFTGILMHEGVSPTDTRGCILVANHFSFTAPHFVTQSQLALNRVMTAIRDLTPDNHGTITIT